MSENPKSRMARSSERRLRDRDLRKQAFEARIAALRAEWLAEDGALATELADDEMREKSTGDTQAALGLHRMADRTSQDAD